MGSEVPDNYEDDEQQEAVSIDDDDFDEVERSPPDIQLTGLGIQQHHCSFEIINNDIFIIPSQGARYVHD